MSEGGVTTPQTYFKETYDYFKGKPTQYYNLPKRN